MDGKTGKGGKRPKLQMYGMLGGIFIGIVLSGIIVRLLIWQNSILLGVPIACLLAGLIAGICEMWSNYRLARKNFEVYQVKKWVGKCLRQMKEGKISETEYRFSGEKQEDYICIETVRAQWQDLEKHHFLNDRTPSRETNAWKVISINNGKRIVHGMFRQKEWAYVFLFYVTAKKYAGINIEKWHWGFGVF